MNTLNNQCQDCWTVQCHLLSKNIPVKSVIWPKQLTCYNKSFLVCLFLHTNTDHQFSLPTNVPKLFENVCVFSHLSILIVFHRAKHNVISRHPHSLPQSLPIVTGFVTSNYSIVSYRSKTWDKDKALKKEKSKEKENENGKEHWKGRESFCLFKDEELMVLMTVR